VRTAEEGKRDENLLAGGTDAAWPSEKTEPGGSVVAASYARISQQVLRLSPLGLREVLSASRGGRPPGPAPAVGLRAAGRHRRELMIALVDRHAREEHRHLLHERHVFALLPPSSEAVCRE